LPCIVARLLSLGGRSLVLAAQSSDDWQPDSRLVWALQSSTVSFTDFVHVPRVLVAEHEGERSWESEAQVLLVLQESRD